MTNRQRFFLNGALLTAVGIAMRSVALGFNSYVTYSIGAEGIGLYTLIGTVFSFAVTFATSGISLTVTKLVSSANGEGKSDSVRPILRSAVFYSLIFSTFAAVTLFSFSSYFGNTVLSDSRTVIPLRILSLSLVPLALTSVFTGYFIGVKRVSRNAVLQVLGQLFKICVTVFFINRFSGLGVERGIIALSISTTLTELAIFLIVYIEFLIDKRRKLTRADSRKSHFHSVCSMALPLALSAYIRSALLSLEHILIPKRLEKSGESHEAALSSYGILHGMALPMLLYPMTPLSSFSGLLVPEFSESLASGQTRRIERVASEALNVTLTYSAVAAVLMHLFSEELGYVFYSSYSAGHYISLMAPVIPIMYLDHVADSMLKGIGEHVYSMWVNISDSFLSVVLVFVLIPRLGIGGYALVIIIMEGYNFLLSILRLRARIHFKISILRCGILPLLFAFISAFISKRAFAISGATVAPVWLFLRVLFAVCIFFAMYMLSQILLEGRGGQVYKP